MMIAPGVQFALALFFLVYLGASIWVANDASKRGMNKYFWLLAMLVFSFLTIILYFVVRKPKEVENIATGPTPAVWHQVRKVLPLMAAAIGLLVVWGVVQEVNTQWKIKHAARAKLMDLTMDPNGAHCGEYVVVNGWVSRIIPHAYVLEDQDSPEGQALASIGAPPHLPVVNLGEASPTLNDFVEVLGQVGCNDSRFGSTHGLYEETRKSVPSPKR